MYGYFDFYVVLFKTIKSDLKTAQKIVNNLINENVFPLNQDGWYKSFNMPISV